MRAYFLGRTWDDNDEFKLKRDLVLRSGDFLPDLPYLIDDEWDVEPGHTNHGRGDLVFTDGGGTFAVVEVKYIDHQSSGSTAQRKRTKNRKTVVEQASRYAREFSKLNRASLVLACTFTNEGSGLQIVERLQPEPSPCE